MGAEHTDVEFLDPDDESGDVDWLDEEKVGAARHHVLPPRTTGHRLAVTVTVFGLALSATGLFGVSEYRHDKAIEAAGNALVLRGVDVGDPVTLTDPGLLGEPNAWRLDPSAAISVGVTNESPDAITLLPGATLLGPGLTGPATLRPAGGAELQPGQSGHLTGVVTVDCGVQTAPTLDTSQGSTVLVQARTADGGVGTASVGLNTGQESVREQICLQEGEGVAASFFPESVNPSAHTFTVAVSAHSLAQQPLHYQLSEDYSNRSVGALGLVPALTVARTEGDTPMVPGVTADAHLPGITLSAPTPLGPVDGVLAAGASLSAGYTIHVLHCPSTLPASDEDVDLQLFLVYHGIPADLQADSFDLLSLVGAACGLIA